MGIFDRFKSQAQDKAKKQSDAAEQKTNERTGGKYEQQLDDAQQRLEDRGGMRRERPPEEP
ncbi:Rv0909 family putative TA system antitoxin [Streptomyces sp. DH24]|uniref:Rv0909 family putative TA system antitoxin n=1 Tax=Streptomyces sp. DH24 TaxID=3040123 RepID=UPI0024417AF1|nr:Rv0909 family putative TA system antitoxin [Streptomyces sp. DH24]MDG9719123.1 antitoxin [Streptomyces sp. DH24]